MVALIYGFDKKTVRRESNPDIVYALQFMCGATIFLSLLGAFRSFYRLISGIFPDFFYKLSNIFEESSIKLNKSNRVSKC